MYKVISRSVPNYIWLILTLLVTAGVYAPIIDNWFLTDDYLFITAFRQTDAFAYIRDAFNIINAPPAPEVRFYRPLHSTTFLVLYKTFGLEASGYHAWSLLVHLANVTLLWLIATRVTGRQLAAGIAAAIFALHPAYADAIAWISNNNALMATCASLFAFWTYLKFHDREPHNRLWYVASVAGLSLALLLHPETGVILLAIVAYRVCHTSDVRKAIRPGFWVEFVPYALLGLAYVAVHVMMANRDFLPQSEGFTLSGNLFRVYLSYFSTATYPIPIDQSALDSPTLVFAGSCLIFVMVVLLASRSRPHLGTFAVFWFLVSVFPLATISSELRDVGIEAMGRKLYSAGPALALMIALLGVQLAEAVPSSLRQAARAILVAAVFVAIVLCGLLAVNREQDNELYAQDTHDFINQLRAEHPTLEPGTTLYIDGAVPISVLYFHDFYLPSLVGLYYDDIEVVYGATPNTLATGEMAFSYKRE